MSEQDFNNPFVDLCGKGRDASTVLSKTCNLSETAAEISTIEMDEEKHMSSHFYEDVFRLTLSKEPCCDKNRPPTLLFLKEVHVALNLQLHMDDNAVSRAIFERMMLEDPSQYVVNRKSLDNEDGNTCEKRVMFYLFQAFSRLKRAPANAKQTLRDTAYHVIVSQAANALCNSEMFPDSKLAADLMELILEYHEDSVHCDFLSEFLSGVTNAILEVEAGDLNAILEPFFTHFLEKLEKVSLSDNKLFFFINIYNYFTVTEPVIKAFMSFSMPKNPKQGKAYQNSLLGLPMGISCLPKNEFDPFEYFQEPSRYSTREHRITEQQLSQPLNAICKGMHQFIEKILRKSADTRELFLTWLGNCLDANTGRAKIWNSHLPEVYASLHASDGFFINLSAVLLLLCKPFSEPNSPRLIKVSPYYCGSKGSSVHVQTLSSETCLLPRDEPMAEDNTVYNFMTECFFATHYAFKIGFHVVNEKLVKLNQDMLRAQRLHEETFSEEGWNSETTQRIKDNMEKGMMKFLSYRTALLVAENLELMMKFQIATSTWLVNMAVPEDMNVFKTMKLPSSKVTSAQLQYVPEMVLENVIDCTLFLKRFNSKQLELQGPNIDHFLTLILMFMGSPERVKNPHLRAHLAEMLESLMPQTEDDSKNFFSRRNSLLSFVYREKLFTSHLFLGELIPTLLNVFVSIEMTGQSVAFEQKFQYRRPMYVVLDYLWKFEVHKIKMKEMAEHAEANLESSHPPIFLHFINLLINDAIFLLDEALSYMSKLRELQIARDSGSWNSMTQDQQQQQEGNLHHIGMLAKFHNVMSNETINTLQWLTTEIKSIFCHPAIVERITAMLNYFLLHLVGPQKKNFKVKDLAEYEFKPQELVRDICRIYHNLGSLDDDFAEKFCSAVSRDGRSYTKDLFPLAQIVLNKIFHAGLANQIEIIAGKVHILAVKQQQDDEFLTNAPEEFLDPIMNTVMKDPVKLPSSGMTIDRATIARHLLSDQTDPFNRSPLTMDMVTPDEELKAKMQKWFEEQRSKA